MKSEELYSLLEVIFTKYGAFTTMFLGLIGYFIKLRYDYKSKKVEINHSIFQQNRIDAVNRFFINYNVIKSTWRTLPHHEVIENIMSAKELDSKVQPSLENIRLSLLELRFYFEPQTYALFEQIEKGLDEIYNTVSYLRREYGTPENSIARGNRFSFTMHDTFRKNDNLIGEVCDLIRIDFKRSL